MTPATLQQFQTENKTMTAYRPTDIPLPDNWTWERVETERAKYGIPDNMVPLCTVRGVASAWGTVNSVRVLRCNNDTR